MNFHEAVAILSPELSKWTREERFTAICAAIRGYNADAMEVRDILGVLIDSMKYRFDESKLGDVHHEFRQLVAALEEFQHEMGIDEPQDCIDAYKDARAREAGL